jgi:hypothetical protein
MKKVNQLSISGTIVDIGPIVKVSTTNDDAINFRLENFFGKRKCNYYGTAYNGTAREISKLYPGCEVTIEGAIYQENYKDKSEQQSLITKIRAVNVICDLIE